MSFSDIIDTILEGFPTRVENFKNGRMPDGSEGAGGQIPFDQEAANALSSNREPVDIFGDEQAHAKKMLQRLRKMNINADMTDLSKIARKQLHQYLTGKVDKEEAQTAVDDLGKTVDAFDKVIGDQELDRVPSWLAQEIFNGQTDEKEAESNHSDMHISADDDVAMQAPNQEQQHKDSNATETSSGEEKSVKDTIEKLQGMGKQSDPQREQARLKALKHAVEKRKRLLDNEYDLEAFWDKNEGASPEDIEAKLKEEYPEEGPEYYKKLGELDQAFERGEVDEWGHEIPADQRANKPQSKWGRVKNRVKKFLNREGRMPTAAELLLEMQPTLDNMIYEALEEA